MYVPRPRLWERLEIAAEGPVTLVVAPVGAGKTLGVAGWLHRSGRAAEARWVSVTPGLGVDRIRALTSPAAGGSRPPLVVLDDAHALSPEALAHLDDRLNLDPQSLRVVLLSRWDLPLTRLVPELLGDFTVLRGELLRLDLPEVAALVAEHARTDSAEVVTAIAARTRGWCAAVVLTARAVAAAPDPVTAVARLTDGNPVVDRVASEVFATLTPLQRHVLLCVADEPVVTPALARHLSRDADAGRVLEDLECTGLLVTRHLDQADAAQAGRGDPAEPGYQVHPLLVEVGRRRLLTGGAEVTRARDAVRRAVALDLDQGVPAGALRRLLGVGAHQAAAGVLAERGVALVLAGEARELRSFVHLDSGALAREPGCWFPVALERWLAGDVAGTRLWLHLLDTHRHAGDGADDRLQRACRRLMRARLGDGRLPDAVDDAVRVLADLPSPVPGERGLLPLLQLLLGTAQLELGRLAEADRNLTAVLLHGRTDLPTLCLEATSQLAVSQLLQGREHACLDLAAGATRRGWPAPQAPTARAGIALARDLALLQAVVDGSRAADVADDLEPVAALHPTDRVGAVLARLLSSRRLLLRGLVAEAERCLDTDPVPTGLPPSLRVPVLLEQALHASLASDHDRLAQLGRTLTDLARPGEAALVAALRADVIGDVRGAVALCAVAVERATCFQPPVVALARTVRAQLLDAEGRSEEAGADLQAALTLTEVRRNMLPFLGWSRHGTPVASLLQGLGTGPWCRELVSATAAHPGGLASLAGPVTATARERTQVPDGVLRPHLSARERDVLHELARGSTYADIAANLYVSENTVKTHVSSLYAKLAVRRRSDALAVARTLHLL